MDLGLGLGLDNGEVDGQGQGYTTGFKLILLGWYSHQSLKLKKKMKWGRYASHELPGAEAEAEACPVIVVTCMSFSFTVPSVCD